MKLSTGIPRCSVRPWRDGDQAALVLHGNNRNVWRNLTDHFPHPYTIADANAWIQIAQAETNSTHLAVELFGEAIGGVGIIAGRGIYCRTGQLGYWLGEAHWGKGIATAASRALVSYWFSTSTYVRLEAPVFAWNYASMRVLEKLGFANEGIRRKSVFKDGQVIDSVIYAKVRDV